MVALIIKVLIDLSTTQFSVGKAPSYCERVLPRN